MLSVPLHVGTEHPNLIWVLVPSLFAFLAGLGIGVSSRTIHRWLQTPTDSSTDH